MFISVFLLPFSLATVLTFTQPVWTAIIARVFASEKLNWFEYVSIVFAFFGIIILTNPTAIFWWIDGERGFDFNDYPYFGYGVFFSLMGAMGSGFAFLCMRYMGQ
jgi:drug/metabolite transporter (DMT)-like permease